MTAAGDGQLKWSNDGLLEVKGVLLFLFAQQTTYPHDLDKEENVDEENYDGRRHVDPVVTVGRHPWTVGQERFEARFLLPTIKQREINKSTR